MSLAVRSAVVHLCTTRGQYLSIISVSAALQESLEPPVVSVSIHSFFYKTFFRRLKAFIIGVSGMLVKMWGKTTILEFLSFLNVFRLLKVHASYPSGRFSFPRCQPCAELLFQKKIKSTSSKLIFKIKIKKKSNTSL